MGHARGRRTAGDGAGEGSTIGRRYRHTTEEMRARIVAVVGDLALLPASP
jgi:hypothetical protein